METCSSYTWTHVQTPGFIIESRMKILYNIPYKYYDLTYFYVLFFNEFFNHFNFGFFYKHLPLSNSTKKFTRHKFYFRLDFNFFYKNSKEL